MAGEWAKFVADNKAADKRISEKKIFPEQQISKYANKIVDKSYQQTKNKNPFTQSAEIAKDLLSFELKDGFIENKDNKSPLFKESFHVQRSQPILILENLASLFPFNPVVEIHNFTYEEFGLEYKRS